MRCPKCFNSHQQATIGINLSYSWDVSECDKCHTLYSTTIFDSREEADEFTESQDGEVM
jgi:hypothetical protein